LTRLWVFSILWNMNKFLEQNLKDRGFDENHTIILFEKTPVVKCYEGDQFPSGRTMVTFHMGAIVQRENDEFDGTVYYIVYSEQASDGCLYFGGFSANDTYYVFEINGHICKTIVELLDYAKSLEGPQLALTTDNVEFMDI